MLRSFDTFQGASFKTNDLEAALILSDPNGMLGEVSKEIELTKSSDPLYHIFELQ